MKKQIILSTLCLVYSTKLLSMMYHIHLEPGPSIFDRREPQIPREEKIKKLQHKNQIIPLLQKKYKRKIMDISSIKNSQYYLVRLRKAFREDTSAQKVLYGELIDASTNRTIRAFYSPILRFMLCGKNSEFLIIEFANNTIAIVDLRINKTIRFIDKPIQTLTNNNGNILITFQDNSVEFIQFCDNKETAQEINENIENPVIIYHDMLRERSSIVDAYTQKPIKTFDKIVKSHSIIDKQFLFITFNTGQSELYDINHKATIEQFDLPIEKIITTEKLLAIMFKNGSSKLFDLRNKIHEHDFDKQINKVSYTKNTNIAIIHFKNNSLEIIDVTTGKKIGKEENIKSYGLHSDLGLFFMVPQEKTAKTRLINLKTLRQTCFKKVVKKAYFAQAKDILVVQYKDDTRELLNLRNQKRLASLKKEEYLLGVFEHKGFFIIQTYTELSVSTRIVDKANHKILLAFNTFHPEILTAGLLKGKNHIFAKNLFIIKKNGFRNNSYEIIPLDVIKYKSNFNAIRKLFWQKYYRHLQSQLANNSQTTNNNNNETAKLKYNNQTFNLAKKPLYTALETKDAQITINIWDNKTTIIGKKNQSQMSFPKKLVEAELNNEQNIIFLKFEDSSAYLINLIEKSNIKSFKNEAPSIFFVSNQHVAFIWKCSSELFDIKNHRTLIKDFMGRMKIDKNEQFMIADSMQGQKIIDLLSLKETYVDKDPKAPSIGFIENTSKCYQVNKKSINIFKPLTSSQVKANKSFKNNLSSNQKGHSFYSDLIIKAADEEMDMDTSEDEENTTGKKRKRALRQAPFGFAPERKKRKKLRQAQGERIEPSP